MLKDGTQRNSPSAVHSALVDVVPRCGLLGAILFVYGNIENGDGVDAVLNALGVAGEEALDPPATSSTFRLLRTYFGISTERRLNDRLCSTSSAHCTDSRIQGFTQWREVCAEKLGGGANLSHTFYF